MCGPRSWLLRLLETLVYSPLLLTGATTQRQWLEISYFTEFYNDPGNMAATITITIQSQFIQVTTLAIVHTVPVEGPYLRCLIKDNENTCWNFQQGEGHSRGFLRDCKVFKL